jgi:hypothetical protein
VGRQLNFWLAPEDHASIIAAIAERRSDILYLFEPVLMELPLQMKHLPYHDLDSGLYIGVYITATAFIDDVKVTVLGSGRRLIENKAFPGIEFSRNIVFEEGKIRRGRIYFETQSWTDRTLDGFVAASKIFDLFAREIKKQCTPNGFSYVGRNAASYIMTI